MRGPQGAPQGRAAGRAPVELRTRFDRFPATIKGALVLRGADGDPHGVRLASAAVARIPSGSVRPIRLGDIRVDVAPARDLFVPFEASVADLEPSWYVVRTEIEVDTMGTWTSDSSAFVVAWPRGAMRTGAVALAGRVTAGGAGEVALDRLELRADRATLTWTGSGEVPGDRSRPLLLVDGVAHEELPEDLGERRPVRAEPGGRAVFYPVPRDAARLTVALAGADADPVEVPLP